MITDDKNGKWYHEIDHLEGESFSLQINKILYQQRSKYQDVLVFKSKSYGNVLVLDDRLQCTERDEFGYHEMFALLPLLAHPKPKRVLIIGGGDGGVLREVVKHPQVEEVVLCDLDQDVIDVSKKFLPGIAKGFSSPKAKIHIGDGFEFVKQHKNAFDVIITDSSDPEGPAEKLFEEPFYQLQKEALKPPHGIICFLTESIWSWLDLIKTLVVMNRKLFPSVAYAHTMIPTYNSGTIGFIICSLDENNKLNEPVDEELANGLNTRYYSANIHRAAFTLPEFVRKALDEKESDKLKQ